MKQTDKNIFNNCAIELLAPGGSVDSIKAAIIAGADAVYCGMKEFNARQRADNITFEELKDLVLIAHQHNCLIYLTLNTLVMENEIPSILKLSEQVYSSGVDAVIVQDTGLIHLLNTYLPDLDIHASTQMTTHNAGQLKFLAKAKITQVNFCRELSLNEIKNLSQKACSLNIKPEVFVHGAYCISFSGQCYMSSAIYGRSGNRGTCVQPCRRSYYFENGKHQGLPLNLKDNSAFKYAKELKDSGAKSLKIEGRIKGYKYVYSVVSAWRNQLNLLNSQQSLSDDNKLFHTVFNRSFSNGYLTDKISRDMFADSSRDQSLNHIANIVSYTADTKTLILDRSVKCDTDNPVLVYGSGFKFICTGFLQKETDNHSYYFNIEHKLKGHIQKGQKLYQQTEFHEAAELKKKIKSLVVDKKPVKIICSGNLGKPLKLKYILGTKEVCVSSEVKLETASKQPLNIDVLNQKLGILADTGYTLENIDCSELQKGLFLPIKELNSMRRHAIALLDGHKRSTVISIPEISIPQKKDKEKKVSLALLVDNIEDIDTYILTDTKIFYEMPVYHTDYVRHFSSVFNENKNIYPWFPPILIDSHFTDAVKLLDDTNPDYIVTENSGIGLESGQRDIRWIAGPLLNCTNSFALQALQYYSKCSGAFISNELGRDQMHEVKSPEDFSCWYTLFAPLLMMNTRQCILRNVSNCKKENFDENCLLNCSQSKIITSDKNEKYIIQKRPGFYNQLYNDSHYFNPAVVKDTKTPDSVFLVDMRQIKGSTQVICSKQEFIEACELFINKKIKIQELQNMIRYTTTAQYLNGI